MKTPRTRYTKAKQDEIEMDGGFRLIVEETQDGHKAANELRAAKEREEQAAKAQLSLF